jgi:hypothetical protein
VNLGPTEGLLIAFWVVFARVGMAVGTRNEDAVPGTVA